MAKNKFSPDELEDIEKQVHENSSSYDYRTKDYPFEVICTKFGEQDNPEATLYVPDYQREFVWQPDKQSRFIESVLLGVPLTPFLVSEDEDNRLEIIDGSQRIRTLLAFYENKLKLRKLKKLTQIEKAKFEYLPRSLQNSIKNRDFRIIVVSHVNLSIRQDIFDRINTSSEKLTDSEIRKGSYSGAFYDLVLELKKDHAEFKAICPVSDAKGKRGEYEELILRFFAYIDRYQEFRHDVAIFLNSYLDEMNETDFEREYYLNAFTNMVDFIKNNFPIGFRKEAKSNSTPRVRFEAIAIGVHLALQENPDLIIRDVSWLDSEEFSAQTTSDGSNNTGRLKNRVEFVRDCLLGKMNKRQSVR
ncbi:MAG: DUF262 domain-containing protein [Candidatus Parabeggiatoa sp. nov. 2]|nr:MAG: hypothetical protein B6247_13970 [Beggiatoa sp. 4572_84]RKZ55591.1 MAG: DUF262 domain-containing protein [Gammaproteobacteria bacterium]